jgi:hypothetical protein
VAESNKQEFIPLLSAGFHSLDGEGRKRICQSRFPDSVTRPRILQNLEALIDLINSQSITGEIWIDGSFLTEKLNPDDADLIWLISADTHKSLNADQKKFFDAFKSESYYERHRIDNYVAVFDPNDSAAQWLYAYWLRQFGFSRDDKMKGILQVKFPFLVKP